jgi:hypothetical protein
MWLLLFCALAYASNTLRGSSIIHESYLVQEDALGWVVLEEEKCASIISLTWYQNIQDIIYNNPREHVFNYYPTNPSQCICQNDGVIGLQTRAIEGFWKNNMAYLLIIHKELGVDNALVYKVITLTDNLVTAEPATSGTTTVEPTTEEPTTVEPTTEESTTVEPTTVEPTMVEPTTVEPTTVEPTTVEPTMSEPATVEPTTVEPTNVIEPSEKIDAAKSSVVTQQSSSSDSNRYTSNVITILLGSFGIVLVVLLILIARRKPPTPPSTNLYDFEVIEKTSESLKQTDQDILKRLGKGASDSFDLNL